MEKQSRIWMTDRLYVDTRWTVGEVLDDLAVAEDHDARFLVLDEADGYPSSTQFVAIDKIVVVGPL